MYLHIYLGKTPKTPKVASNRKLKNWGLLCDVFCKNKGNNTSNNNGKNNSNNTGNNISNSNSNKNCKMS